MKKQIDTYTRESIMPVVESVCELLQISVEDALKPGRRGINVLARQIAMYILAKKTKYKLVQIGGFFDLDHATIGHNVQRIDWLLDSRDSLVTHCYNSCVKNIGKLLKSIEEKRKELDGLKFILSSATTFI